MNRVIALLVLLGLLALAACTAPTLAPQATAVAPPARGGTIVNGTYADAKVLNPHITDRKSVV